MIQLDHKARNVIFFMGDGLGLPTVTAARVYRAQARNITGDDAVLSWEKFPYTAFSKARILFQYMLCDSVNLKHEC